MTNYVLIYILNLKNKRFRNIFLTTRKYFKNIVVFQLLCGQILQQCRQVLYFLVLCFTVRAPSYCNKIQTHKHIYIYIVALYNGLHYNNTRQTKLIFGCKQRPSAKWNYDTGSSRRFKLNAILRNVTERRIQYNIITRHKYT